MDNDAKTRTFLGDSGLSQAHGLGHADSHLGRPPFFPGFSRCGVPKNDIWPLPKTCGVSPEFRFIHELTNFDQGKSGDR